MQKRMIDLIRALRAASVCIPLMEIEISGSAREPLSEGARFQFFCVS